MKKSLVSRILRIILYLVIPLNVLSLIATFTFARSQGDLYQMNIQNIANIYIADLQNSMSRADRYLFTLETEDADCLAMEAQTGDADYINARYRTYLNLKDHLADESLMDGYYFYMQETGDSILAVSGVVTEQDKTNIEKDIRSADDMETGWQIRQIDGKDYLFQYYQMKNYACGAFISMDQQYEEILSAIPFAEASVSCEEEALRTRGCISTIASFPDSNLKLVVTFPQSVIIRNLSIWTKILLLASLVSLLVIPVLYYQLKKLVVRPIEVLNRAHHEMEQGNRTYKIQEEADTREFETAYHSFNTMMDSMENLRLENMQKELARKKLEVRNLQLQIRPHFLLNSFNLIFMFCEQGNTQAIQKMILYLSEYFRYIFRSGKELELFGKELHLIEGYINAAKIRYPDRVFIMYDIDPEVEMVRVPPLLIHNFIENVIVHAMVPGQAIHIVLSATYEEQEACFIISDDGSGMDEEQVRKMNTQNWQEQDQGHHMGIRNSVQRLKTFYGEKATVKVSSVLGEGTEMEIRIPYNLGEETE